MKHLQSLFFFLVFLFSQNQLSAQTASVTQGCTPLEVQFSSNMLTDYFWEFKDGATSTLANPTNTFITPGVYDVELFEGTGGTLIGSVTITVYPQPELMITATPLTGCGVPLDIDFEDNSNIPAGINVTNYQWVFGDGGTGQGSTVSHTYTSVGEYTIGLNIETNITSCNVTQLFTNFVSVNPIPDANFVTNPNPALACEGPFVVGFNNLTANPNDYTFGWDFGNGATSTLANPPSQTYNEGQYTVALTVTDAVGCSKTITQGVSVGAPLASFNIPDTVCLGQELTIQNQSSAGVYSWNFGASSNPSTSSAFNPSVTFNAVGLQEITLTVSSSTGICSSDTTVTVFVDEVNATFSSDPSYTCEAELTTSYSVNSTVATNFMWSFSDGETSTEQFPTHMVSDFSTDSFSINNQTIFNTQLIVTNPSGCSATYTLSDTIHRPNSLFITNKVDGCVPLIVEFTDESTSAEDIVDWEWHFGDGTVQNFNTPDPFDYTYTTSGDFQSFLIITNDAGCKDTSYIIPIEVGEMITPSFMADQTEVCPGDTVNIQDLTNDDRIDTWHFETDNGRSFHCYQDPQLSWTFDAQAAPMDVSLTVGYNGCYTTHTEEDLILVKGPIAKIDYLMECGSPFDFQFRDSSYSASSVTWDFGDGMTSTNNDLTHTYDTTGNYMVILTAENATSGCPASMDTAMVFVREIEAAFQLDTELCYGSTQNMNASASIDVHNECWRGYTWITTFNRPITTQDSNIPLIFSDSGMHSITLITTDINGCTDTTSQDVDVFATRPAFIADETLICFPEEVNFTDLTTSDTTIVSWDWTFGDGETSTDQNPTHIYTNPPTGADFVVAQLTTTDVINCTYTAFQVINIYTPTSQITASPSILCLGEEVSFSATDYTAQGSNLTFDWNFDNGGMSSNQSETITYVQEGTYSVQLNIEEIATGCQNSTSVIVEVQGYPEADFNSSVDNQAIICYPENIIFTDNTTSTFPLTYNWDFGNGQTGTNSSFATSYDKGTFEITLITSTTAGCRDTIMKTVSLVGPEGDFDLDQSSICKGDIITFNLKDTIDISSYSWDFGDGTGADDVDPVSHQYNFLPPGSQTVAKLILRGLDDACAIAVEYPIEIINVLADFTQNNGLDSILCVGEILFTNQSINADIYNWDFGDGVTSTEFSPIHTYSTTGSFFVDLAVESNNLGCKDTLTREITVTPLPTIEIIGDTICSGENAILSTIVSDPSVTYIWTPVDEFTDNTVANPTVAPLVTSTYEVMVTDQNDCVGSASGTVEVVSEPVEITWDTLIGRGHTATLPFTYNPNLYAYSWSSTQGFSCENCSNPVVAPAETTTYVVTVSDIFGCFTTTYTFNVVVLPEEVDMPNVFTPDNDGVNDFFNYVLLDGEAQYASATSFKIFNRWGQKVYDNDTPSTGWDGMQNGKNAPSDVYVYVVEVLFITGNTVNFQGDVTLIR